MNIEKPSAGAQGVGLVQKTLQILDLFQVSTPVWTQVEIAQTTGLPRSTVNRLVKFLADQGYLRAVAGRGGYSLGAMAIDLGRRANALFDLRNVCRPTLEELARETGETVILTSVVAAGNAVCCVDQIESTREGLRVFESVGSLFALNAGAAPKAVLAALSDAEVRRFIGRDMARVTGRTITDAAELSRDVAATRERGYAVSIGETYDGVIGVAAAFFWGTGKPAGSIAIAAPQARMDEAHVRDYGARLVRAAEGLNRLFAPGSAAEAI